MSRDIERFLRATYPGRTFRLMENARYRETNNIVSLATAFEHFAQPSAPIVDLTSDGVALYWLTTTGAIESARLGAGGAPIVSAIAVRAGIVGGDRLLVDAGRLSWSEIGGGPSSPGRVASAAKDGSDLRVHWTGAPQSGALALDSLGV